MVSDFGNTRYCKKCGLEIIRKGDCVTMSANSKFCECDAVHENTGLKHEVKNIKNYPKYVQDADHENTGVKN